MRVSEPFCRQTDQRSAANAGGHIVMHVAQLCILCSDLSLELFNLQLELGCELGRAGGWG